MNSPGRGWGARGMQRQGPEATLWPPDKQVNGNIKQLPHGAKMNRKLPGRSITAPSGPRPELSNQTIISYSRKHKQHICGGHTVWPVSSSLCSHTKSKKAPHENISPDFEEKKSFSLIEEEMFCGFFMQISIKRYSSLPTLRVHYLQHLIFKSVLSSPQNLQKKKWKKM